MGKGSVKRKIWTMLGSLSAVIVAGLVLFAGPENIWGRSVRLADSSIKKMYDMKDVLADRVNEAVENYNILLEKKAVEAELAALEATMKKQLEVEQKDLRWSFEEEWNGKKVAWYGDSLTELYYHCKKVDDYFNFEGYNCGIRGSAITYIDDKSMCLQSRMKQEGIAIPDDVEVIFVMAGTNDWCANVPLGDKRLTYDEDGNLRIDNTTFYGACHQMFNNLTTLYPDAYILVLGTPFAASNTYDIYNEEELTSLDYGDALCEIASMWGIPSFNIGEMMGINVNNVEDSKALMYEGIHFVEGGARMAANVIIEQLAQRKCYK